MIRSMTIRLYPTKRQEERLEYYLLASRITYNRALDANIFWYESTGKRLNYYDHCADLTALRSASSFWSDVPLRIQRDALRRLDKAFQGFFRRLRQPGRKPGFPRFKGRNRWNSFTINDCGNVIQNGRILVSRIDGTIRARHLRNFTGTIKEQRIIRRVGKWFCELVIDDGTVAPPLKPIENAVGIDVGLKQFAVLSNGDMIDNPRFGKTLAKKLAHAQRSLSRKKKGSNNRRKSVRFLRKIHSRIADSRLNFSHQLSRRIVNAYDFIAVEDLNVAGMSRGRLAKSILDACWSQFTGQLSYKAESAGCTFVKVNPNGTSQECSRCGRDVPKDLKVRIHSCPNCGLVLDRDHNAAINILQRGLVHPAPVGRSVMPVEASNGSPLKQEVAMSNATCDEARELARNPWLKESTP